MKKIAVYDVDYTILDIDSLVRFIIFLVRKNPARLLYFPLLLGVSILRLFRLISMERFKSFWLILLKGTSKGKLEKLTAEFAQTILLPNIKGQVLPQIKSLKKKGYTILLVTASFEIYMKYLCEKIKPDYCIGTRITSVNGRYALKGKNCKGKEKIKRIAKELDLSQIDKANSVSFTDSKSDLPFLEITDTLYFVKKREWDIIDTVKN